VVLENTMTNGTAIMDSPQGEDAAEKRIRIVIADDHPIVRDGIKRLLALESDIDVVGEAGERHYYDPQSGEVMLAGWRAVTDGVDHWYGHANHRGSSWVAPLLHPAASPGSVFRRAAEGGGSA